MTDATTVSDPLIRVTPAAAEELKAMLARPENANRTLRLYVEKGGCSGMQYGMTFDEQRDGDVICSEHGVRVLVDAFSAPYLRGLQVDFSDALTGGGFKMLNPNARESCGCGRSFTT